MYLQGNLQNVFDALYHLGVIDPVLEMDWSEAMEDLHRNWDKFSSIIHTANRYQDNPDILVTELQKFDSEVLGYLAMEVAKEFADFHSREDLQ
jgi:hypothetical protein